MAFSIHIFTGEVFILRTNLENEFKKVGFPPRSNQSFLTYERYSYTFKTSLKMPISQYVPTAVGVLPMAERFVDQYLNNTYLLETSVGLKSKFSARQSKKINHVFPIKKA